MGEGGKRELTPLEAVLVRDASVRDTLLRWARRRTPDAASAEDLFAETLRAAVQRERVGERWDPDGTVSALAHLGSILSGIRANNRRYQKRRPLERVEDADGAQGPTPWQPIVSAEQALIDREDDEQRGQLKAEVRRRLAEDTDGALPIAMMDAADEGIHGPKRLAEHLQCPIDKVRLAQRRIAYHARKLVKLASGGDEEARA